MVPFLFIFAQIKSNMIGIYKITSPNERVYIGQSVNIQKRFSGYRRMKSVDQSRLHASFLKYGIDNHVFEIIEECDFLELNKRERFYQDMYDVLGPKGLNCVLTSTDILPEVKSEETRRKISVSNTGKRHTESAKNKVSIANIGKVLSVESRKKLSEARKGMIFSEETKKRISESKKGKKTKRDYSLSKGLGNEKSKIILDLQAGVFYYGVADASRCLGKNKSVLLRYLNGTRKNKTNLIYV
jgi:group I intron endonuclease